MPVHSWGSLAADVESFGGSDRSMRREWDFAAYKVHPLWDQPEPTLRIRAGDMFYRGTTTSLVGESVRAAPRATRIYFSESEEDAAGYAFIHQELYGGKPVLVELKLSRKLFRALKPGLEGVGEWYFERNFVPRTHTRIRRLTRTRVSNYLRSSGLEAS